MASAKELKEWEAREKTLRASLANWERFVRRDAETLEKTKQGRDNYERALAEHLARAPILTPKQAAKRSA